MADVFSKEERSRIMARVKGRDTAPERRVRSMLHRMGCRFRLHRADLPGRPDVALPGRRAAVFVHGCFWHGHAGCRRSARPSSRRAYWNKKIDGNIARDARDRRALRRLGWRILVVWECELRDPGRLERRLRRFLAEGGARPPAAPAARPARRTKGGR